MDALMGVAGLIFVGAMTPGPNNLVAMRAGARRGLLGALPAIAGILSGTFIMLALVVTSAGLAFAADPRVRTGITACGCVYLCWLGVSLVASSLRGGATEDDARADTPPVGFLGPFWLQFLNPKGWVMVLTATSAVRAEAGALAAFAHLAVLFILISTACLLVWSSLGSLLTELLRRKAFRAWFDRLMGGALVASAVLLLMEA